MMRDVAQVVAPADTVNEECPETRPGAVERIALHPDERSIGQRGGNQAEAPADVDSLVDDASVARMAFVEQVQVEFRQLVDRLSVREIGIDVIAGHAPRRNRDMLDDVELAPVENGAVAGKDMLHQCGAGPWQAGDEDRAAGVPRCARSHRVEETVWISRL